MTDRWDWLQVIGYATLIVSLVILFVTFWLSWFPRAIQNGPGAVVGAGALRRRELLVAAQGGESATLK
jgi:hypothetical protein